MGYLSGLFEEWNKEKERQAAFNRIRQSIMNMEIKRTMSTRMETEEERRKRKERERRNEESTSIPIYTPVPSFDYGGGSTDYGSSSGGSDYSGGGGDYGGGGDSSSW